MTLRRSVGSLALTVFVGLTVVACTSSGNTSPSTRPVTSSTAPAASTSAPSLPSASPSLPSSSASTSRKVSTSPTSRRPSTTLAMPSPVSSTTSRPGPVTTATLTPPPSDGGTCTAAQLRLGTMRGGASQGREYGAVTFTNTSSSRCTMRGFPAAQLLRSGGLLGNPAAHDTSGTVRTVTLRPGAMVQSVISAVSTCQSPLSDHVRVIVPGSRTGKDVGIELRACSLTIGPLDLP